MGCRRCARRAGGLGAFALGFCSVSEGLAKGRYSVDFSGIFTEKKCVFFLKKRAEFGKKGAFLFDFTC